MENLKLYRIQDDYISYLHDIDRRVQNNKERRRPYVGVVLKVEEHQYFVPMESPKPNHANVKSAKHIMKIGGGKYGLLGFNNMIPVPEIALIEFRIETAGNEQYQELLKNQLEILNNERQRVIAHAEATYKERTVKKSYFLTKICCDFKALEAACSEYEAEGETDETGLRSEE